MLWSKYDTNQYFHYVAYVISKYSQVIGGYGKTLLDVMTMSLYERVTLT